MDTPEKLRQNDCSNDNNDAASSSPQKAMSSPKTPVRTPLDDSFDDYLTDEMESPQFPHLIPVYNRRNSNDHDLDDVRIGWDDGYGSVCYQDDDYGSERNGRRFKRSRSGRLFTDHRHQSMFGSQKTTKSPSPSHAVIQAELNDYLGHILNCLSAKKRNRQLTKSKSETNTSNNVKENNNISHLLNDSTDDEMMMLCSQAIENTISLDANYNSTELKKPSKSNSLSIVGIHPLNNTCSELNNSLYHQSTNKFKPTIQCKQIDEKEKTNCQTKCHTVTSETKNESQNEANNCLLSTTNNNKDSLSSLLNDSLANDDELFSALDLSAIEQQVVSNVKDSAIVTKNNVNTVYAKQPNTTFLNAIDNKSGSKLSTTPSSVLWRRSCSSSSIVTQSQQNKPISGVNVTTNNSKINGSGINANGTRRYCTPAEIEEKRNRARRTLMLKFKSKNKSAF